MRRGKGLWGTEGSETQAWGVVLCSLLGGLHALVSVVWNWDLAECHICGFPTSRLRETGQARFWVGLS